MDVVICSSYVPFLRGGGRSIVEWLEEALLMAGHRVETVLVPHVGGRDRLISQMIAYRMIDLAGQGDRMIAIRPPAHLIPHPSKVLWFIHHFREYYDLWGVAGYALPDTSETRAERDLVIAADNRAFAEARGLFSNSQVVAGRMRRYNGVAAETLYPPLHQPERFHCAGYGDEIVYVCRVEPHKQQHLLVEAMRHITSGVRLRICGTGVDAAYLAVLRAQVADYRLEERVTLDLRWVDESEKIALIASALAIVYAPYDEDSYGYPSLEASYASKCILTTTTSGGVLELVEDGVNGVVVEPDPQAIAIALDRLFVDRARTIAMGRRARERLRELRIDWDHVVERLLA